MKCPQNLFDNDAILIAMGALLSIGSGIITSYLLRFGRLRFFASIFACGKIFKEEVATRGFQDSIETPFVRVSLDLNITNSSLDYKILQNLKFSVTSASCKNLILDVNDNLHSIENGDVISYLTVNPQSILVNGFCFILDPENAKDPVYTVKFNYKDHKGREKSVKLLTFNNTWNKNEEPN